MAKAAAFLLSKKGAWAMAKEFAKSFYNSKAWKETRQLIIERDRGRCQECGRAANEVDHIEELTKDNIDDTNITLNPDNLRLLCHECHTRKTKQEQARQQGNKQQDYLVLDKIIFDVDGFPIVGSPPKKI